MSSGPKAPTASALNQQQSASNIATATAQQNMSMIDQKNPLGSQKYTQIGTNPDGTPKYQSTIELSSNFSGLPGQVGGLLAQPYKDYSADRQKTEDTLMGRLNTQFDRDRGSMEQSLANKGIALGSQASNNAYDDFNRSVAEGRTSAILGAGQEQSRLAQLDMSQRAQGVNELTALATGGQVATPQAGVAPTDTAGNAMGAYNAQKQQNDGMWNAIGSVAGTAAKVIPWSDERLKEDKTRVGYTNEGTPIYTYRYKGSPMMQMGVMAQEQARNNPNAVKQDQGTGFLKVDYRKVR